MQADAYFYFLAFYQIVDVVPAEQITSYMNHSK